MDTIERLRQFRMDNKLTYRELADRLNTTHNIIYDTLNDRRRFIDFTLLQRINKLLQEG